jgi:peptide deformylase
MPILSLVHYPTPTLKQPSRDLTIKELRSKETAQLIVDMEKAMRRARGIGIAAPQVGHNIRLALVDTRQGPIVIANPRIVRGSLRKVNGEEGCLSVPGVFGDVKRFRAVSVHYLDEHGDAHEERVEGMLARVFQHEIDHLNGTLFIDRVKRITHGTLPDV